MTVRDEMIAELAKGPLCDDCLGEILKTQRQRFNMLGRELEAKGAIKRPRAVCPRCHKTKMVSYLLTQPTAEVAETVEREQPVVQKVTTGQPWHWEGNVQAMLARYLHEQGYRIVQVADTAARTPGIDLIAVAPGGKRLLVTVKGYPVGKSNHTQARHNLAEAIFDIVLYRQMHPAEDLAIALPDGFTTYTDLIPRVRWLMQTAPFRVFLVREDGAVRVEG